MKITQFELENVKRVKAVAMEPALNGLTVIGGKNGQGKTSVLDAIAWALGGENYRPTNAQRDDSVLPPKLHVVLDNGIVVDRTGKNSSLRVTDPSGKLAGQKLLDEFVEKLALDLPKFMQQSSRDKARTLLRIIGMEEELKRLDDQEQQTYNRRRTLGQIADQKAKYAEGLAEFREAPDEPLSAGMLIEQQQEIMRKNAANQLKRDMLAQLESQRKSLEARYSEIGELIDGLKKQLKQVDAEIVETGTKQIALMSEVAELADEDTHDLEEQIAQIDQINAKVRANIEKRRARDEAEKLRGEYEAMTDEIEKIRSARTQLLNGANMPLSELSVEQGELLYKGKAWDCMSGSERLRVAVSIVQAINPQCRFVLLDGLEAMDMDTMHEFGKWLEEKGLQAICTRVGTDGGCDLIIEDGIVAEKRTKDEEKAAQWQKGVF